MTPQRPAPEDVPILKGRLLGTLLLSVAFLTSMALGIASRQVLIPIYLMGSTLFLIIFNAIQGTRINAYMKAHLLDEYWKWVPRDNEYGYSSLRGLRFAFSAGTGDAPALAQIRRGARRTWVESLLVLPYTMVMILVGVALSR